ncbi:26S proteasome subunit P45 family protein [Dictyocaulus viviparus]|uniref:26S proteasome subunit P45 family protein n=1 Tax=Dictyocaulus viviparus TaxID=29172 RepID=A0A0D8Y5D3_DICVI|nr:26S proteasome subunit P45 family protein [Dictyocaulus viviparus]
MSTSQKTPAKGDTIGDAPAVEKMEVEEALDEEILRMAPEDLRSRTHLLDNEIRIMRSEVQRINHSVSTLRERIKDNNERIKVNKTLPYLVSNVVELLDLEDNQEEEGANVDLDAHKTKCAVIKTSTRATYFLPVVGLVEPSELKPGDLVGVNKDSYLILEKLPAEYDSRVKAMEVDERPSEQYSDIGGCDKQIQELIEAVVLPMTHKDRFVNLGIHPPKGVLMYGPPGTGKTMMARAVAAQTKSTFLKLAGPQLVQMFIGDGAKLVRDAFALAKEKAPAIIFIDELDAIGTKRFDSEKAGDREVQRTMLELLNQLDGFHPNDEIKVIAATNRIDVLDPALLRSGRLDRKIELPHPNEDARARIMQIHSRKMNVNKDVNFEELARCTDDFNGAQCKAVCVEAGMIALRRDATEVVHEDFMDAILELTIIRINRAGDVHSYVLAKGESIIRYRPMSLVVEPLPHRNDVNGRVHFPLPPGDDELSIIAGRNNFGFLNVIEWDHMDLSIFYPAALGSTWTVRTCLYPLAVLRSRLQLQKQHTVYSSTMDALTHIWKQEGFRGLYRASFFLFSMFSYSEISVFYLGFWVTIPQIGTSFIYATVYEKLRAVLQRDYGIQSVAAISSVAGGAASFATQIIFVPTDIVAQFMMIYYRADRFISGNDRAVINYVRNERNSRLTLGLKILKALYRIDGVKGFYRGFWASSFVYVPNCLVFWPTYYWAQDFCKWARNSRSDEYSLLLMDQAFSAFIGGICSTICTNPMEVFRIRIQVHRTSYLDTLSRLMKYERYAVFTKGLTPRLVSNSIYTCVVMVGYEIVKRLCVLPEYKERMSSDVSEAFDLTSKEKLLVIQWEHLDLWRFYPLALASSWSIRCLLYPMSVVKSRLQLQRQNNVYRGMRHAFTEILRVEGIGAFYRVARFHGFWMTLPQLSASFLYSSTYERVRDLLQVHIGIKNPPLVSALAGAIASPCAQLVFVPTDIIAQHMMIHNNPEAFGGSRKNIAVASAVRNDGLEGRYTLGLRVLRAVYKVDGLSGFYRGFISAVMLYIPSTMVFWSTYYHALGVFRKIRAKVSKTSFVFLFIFLVTETQRGVRPKSVADVDNRNFFLDQAVSGSIGGIASACVTNPLEILRIRLQGLAPRIVSNALYSSLVMLAYETVKKLCVLPEYQDLVVW